MDPASGSVVGWLRLADLRQRAVAAAAADARAGKGKRANGRQISPEVVNGIAYDAEGGRLFVTVSTRLHWRRDGAWLPA